MKQSILFILLAAGQALAGDAARDARWTADLNYLATQLPQRHANLFFHVTPAEFNHGASPGG